MVDQIAGIARLAGDANLEVYQRDFQARAKDDASPVTEADERTEALIVAALERLTPGVPVVADEGVAAGRVPVIDDEFWLVDLLDGTKEFISRNGDFTVNIALVRHGVLVAGVVFAPALDHLFAGAAGGPAWVEQDGERRALQVRWRPRRA